MISKKLLVVTSIVLGVLLLTTSAFADMMIGNGYSDLKEGMKNLFRAIEYRTINGEADQDNNFTLSCSVFFNEGNKVIESVSYITKIEDDKCETIHEFSGQTGSSSHYDYYDNEKQINKYNGNEKYSVYYYDKNHISFETYSVDRDLFETDIARDAEKVLDAFVGNLSSMIAVKEENGKKVYSGSIETAQIPTYANALASFAIKYGFLNNYRSLDYEIKNDVYITSVTGKAIESEAGILSNVHGTLAFRGTDNFGVVHHYTVDVYLELTDIGTTEIVLPDLSDANVIEKHATAEEYKGTPERFKSMEGTYSFAVVDYASDSYKGSYELVIENIDDNGDFTGRIARISLEGGEIESYELTGYYDESSDMMRAEYSLNESDTLLLSATYFKATGVQFFGELFEDGMPTVAEDYFFYRIR